MKIIVAEVGIVAVVAVEVEVGGGGRDGIL